MESVLSYALRQANDDVRQTVDWLLRSGFVVAESRGGATEGFGNLCLLFTGTGIARIVRDRGQWDITLGNSSDGELFGLAALAHARDGSAWALTRDDVFPAKLPEQLPAGVSWTDTVPGLLDWLRARESVALARAAQAAGRNAMQRVLNAG